MKNIKIGLLPRIFIAIILGILLGGIMPHWLLRVFATVSDLFSEFLGFIVPLLILSLVTVAIVEQQSENVEDKYYDYNLEEHRQHPSYLPCLRNVDENTENVDGK